MSLILTEEQIKTDQLKRKQEFLDGIEALEKKTKIGMRPQIHPNGPMNVLIDLKNDTNTTGE